MANEWILDVLADLETFARDNGLPALASGIDDLGVVAATELAMSDEGASVSVQREFGQAGNVLRAHGGCRDAG